MMYWIVVYLVVGDIGGYGGESWWFIRMGRALV